MVQQVIRPVQEFQVQFLDIFGPHKVTRLLQACVHHDYTLEEARLGLIHAQSTGAIKVGYWTEYCRLPGQSHPWIAKLRSKVANFLSCLILSLALTLSAQEMPSWTTVEITAYCPCVICCGDHADGRTANMTNVLTVPYNLAADQSLPMGTEIYIPLGFGVLDNVRKSDRYFSIDDRGGALDTESKKYKIIRLDLRVREHSWAVKFGRKRIPVIINSVKDAGVK